MTKKNPYLIPRPATISFSGGRTSGYMLYRILEAYDFRLPDDIAVCFANTGLEAPETYEFVHQCETRWKVKVHWLEYAGKGNSPREVRYGRHSINGDPFTWLIDDKRHLPNIVARFCTIELKIKVIDRWAKIAGFPKDRHEAIGLRYDEPSRVASVMSANRRSEAVCPIHDAKEGIQEVNAFWESQPFRLEIPQWLGNCQGCFLKGLSRIQNVARQRPDALGWWAEQEQRPISSKGRARFRSDRPGYAAILERERMPTLFDLPMIEDDGQSINCVCTD